MDKRVSIKDIARHLGVSTALISYVLNNKDERVSPEMAIKIRKAAVEMNYRPNLIAKSLKSGKTNTLGLIVADISNPFFSSIARIIEDEAKRYGYTVIFGSSDESVEKSQGLIEALLNRQVDAMIIAPAEFSEQQIMNLCQEKDVPYVLIDRYFPKIDSNCVRINNYQASYNAVEHLVKMGNRRIVMMAYNTGMEHIGERKRGYTDALKDNQIILGEDWLALASYHHLEDDVERVMRRLLLPEPRVDAFFFATNTLAVQGLKQIVKLGIKVPEELAVISFDESDAFDFFYSPITYVRQSLPDIGREAVRLVMDNIGQMITKHAEVVVNASLVIRESCGAKARKSALRVASK